MRRYLLSSEATDILGLHSNFCAYEITFKVSKTIAYELLLRIYFLLYK